MNSLTNRDASVRPAYLSRVGRGRKIYTVLLFLQSALVLTGGIVRITGSGLGCPTWPECTEGSYTPTPHQDESPLHAWIEFGNRLLTFALAIAAIAAIAYALKFIPNRRIRFLALLQFLGIVAQAILGGITVLTGLHPATVSAHLLLSILLISGALSLRQRVFGKIPRARSLENSREVVISPLTMRLSQGLVALGFLVIVIGTLVTGSGPHAGDVDSPRFGFDLRVVAWIHADLVIAFLGVSLATLVSIKASPQSDGFLARKLLMLIGISLAQGGIGYLQYFTGVPEILVAAHLIGAVAVWLSLWNFYIAGSVSLSKPR
jgi:heme a synthase